MALEGALGIPSSLYLINPKPVHRSFCFSLKVEVETPCVSQFMLPFPCLLRRNRHIILMKQGAYSHHRLCGMVMKDHQRSDFRIIPLFTALFSNLRDAAPHIEALISGCGPKICAVD